MNIIDIERWHKAARPEPTDRDFNVQLGCHFEEIAEMIADLQFSFADGNVLPGVQTWAHVAISDLAYKLKQGTCTAAIKDRENFLKELCDQVVTATGVAYCTGMDFPAALWEVNHSNYSKFGKDCKPIRDENGKIVKGTAYMPPDLSGMY